jgi:hypothetical protein
MPPKENPQLGHVLEATEGKRKRFRGLCLLLTGKEPDELSYEQRMQIANLHFLLTDNLAEAFEASAAYIRSQDTSLPDLVRRRNSRALQRRLNRFFSRLAPGLPRPRGRKRQNYERDKKIRELKEQEGLSFGMIGGRFGMTPQAACRAYKRRVKYDEQEEQALTVQRRFLAGWIEAVSAVSPP